MEAALGVTLLVSGLIIYFMPLIVALLNSRPNTMAIGALNLLLGWTFIGWVVALVWSLTKAKKH